MTEDLAAAQDAFGFKCLGPVVASFLHDLNGVLERLVVQRGGRALFVSRGGLLIEHALNAYRAAIGASPHAAEGPLYISRFMAAKGAWGRARGQALALIDREFGAATGAEYLRRLDPTAQIELADGPEFASFSEFLRQEGPIQRLSREYLDRQAELVTKYVAGQIARHSLVALVDTGWQGTIQSLLTHSHPAHEFWGVNFGRHGKVDPAISPRLLGLAFRGDFEPAKPLSAIGQHRHLIEALFEPVGPSVECVEELKGEVRPAGAEAFMSPEPRPSEPALYGGVLRYVREVAPTLSYSALLRERDLAAKQLAQTILYPSHEMARVLGAFTRSMDFGRGDARCVLVNPAESQLTPEERIQASQWKQGQIALECRPNIARERQRALIAPRSNAPRPRSARADARDPACPKVAIIMRTKDRLLFLQRALEGIARQTFDDYVLVVFNDGGDVVGVEAELELSRLDRRKVILLDGGENRGMEAASNAAIAHVNSEYIVIHDDDDSWIVDFLEKTVRYLDANPDAAGVVTRSYYVEDEISGDQVVAKRRTPYNGWLNVVQLGELLANNFFPPISFLFRRSHYEAVGGFDESLPVLGDWHFNVRMAAQGDIGVVPETLANYHYRDAAGSYANSIVGGSDLHARYNPIVRRKLLALEGISALAGASLVSPLVAEVRGLVRNPHGASAEAGLAAVADHRWCMLAYARAHPQHAPDMTLKDALRFAKERGVPPPPDFDESAYLQQNPDVHDQVRAGRVASGFLHYLLYGRQEGRRRPLRLLEGEGI